MRFFQNCTFLLPRSQLSKLQLYVVSRFTSSVAQQKLSPFEVEQLAQFLFFCPEKHFFQFCKKSFGLERTNERTLVVICLKNFNKSRQIFVRKQVKMTIKMTNSWIEKFRGGREENTHTHSCIHIHTLIVYQTDKIKVCFSESLQQLGAEVTTTVMIYPPDDMSDLEQTAMSDGRT